MLRISKARPTRFTLATKSGERIADLSDGHFFGFGVDTGTACFIDHRLLVSQNEETSQANSRELAEQMLAERKYHGVLSLNAPNGDGLIAFSSGYGDGTYPAFWGFDHTGEICCLVLDFGVLIEPDETEVEIRSIIKKSGTTLKNRVLDEEGITVEVHQPSGTCLDVTIHSTRRDADVYAFLRAPGEWPRETTEGPRNKRTTRFKTRRKLKDNARLGIQIDKGIRAMAPLA